ncbi:hypothetical protein [Bradyrhizobium forestalis]|uniref:hypothetical protein n=1 Tax=Bradyrhizobium forestalis TaxID=1419263 RepID=UPI00142DEECE|nr:hypothetical protein [Bradyrhizobium forestalis]
MAYQVQNDRFLTKPLVVAVGLANMTIDSLRAAAVFIEQHGTQALHWQTAAVAVEHADRDEKLLDHATKSLENALLTDGFIKPPGPSKQP